MRLAAVLLVAALAGNVGAAQPMLSTIEYKFAGGTAYLEANDITPGETKVVLEGNAHLKIVAKDGMVFESRATDTTILLMQVTKNGKPAGSDVKSIAFVGPVHITQSKPKAVKDDAGKVTKVMTRMDADADDASYDGVKQMAYLTGNVTMKQTDASVSDNTTVATGQKVEINMKPAPGPEDLVFLIDTPGGLSHVEVVPNDPQKPTGNAGTVLEAAEITGIGERTTLSGGAHAKLVDVAAGTVFETRAQRITVEQFAKQAQSAAPAAAAPAATGLMGLSGLAAIKSADLVGPVHITYCKPKLVKDEKGQESSVMTQMDADADSARYDGVTQMAYLTGNVTMTQTDPTVSDAPSVATTQSAQINMNPNRGPDDFVFRISTPGGVSQLEITPKAKEETATK